VINSDKLISSPNHIYANLDFSDMVSSPANCILLIRTEDASDTLMYAHFFCNTKFQASNELSPYGTWTPFNDFVPTKMPLVFAAKNSQAMYILLLTRSRTSTLCLYIANYKSNVPSQMTS